MAKSTQSFGDFRPVRVGDKGYWYKDGKRITVTSSEVKARWFVSPSTGEMIPLRQYQNRARGVTYTDYVREQEKKGVKKKEYKTAGHVKIGKPLTKKPAIRKVFKLANKNARIAQNRAEFLKESWATKRSEEYGVNYDFEGLPDYDKTAFWHVYHEVIGQGSPPTYQQWKDEELDEFFDLDYQDWGDIEYGETP